MFLPNPHSENAVTVTPKASTPSGIVTLHELCSDCSQFCRRWKVLDDLQQGKLDDGNRMVSAALLCSVAQLVENEGSCHLCHFLYAALRKERKFMSEQCLRLNVYLRPRVMESAGDVVVEAEVCEKADMNGAETRLFVSFVLNRYNRKSISIPSQI
jgi:hypothetical protein